MTDTGHGEPGAHDDGPASCAQSFLDAIVWGRHTVIWELLSNRGRGVVLAVALDRGMDRVVASRLRDGLADPVERERFLGQLVDGLRRDLRSVDLDQLRLGPQVPPDEAGQVAVELVVPSTIPGTGDWPAGRLVLGIDGERGWRVERLEPRLVSP